MLLRAGGLATAGLGAGCTRGSVSGASTDRPDTVCILSKDVQAVRNFNIFSPANHSGPCSGLITEQIVRLDLFDGATIKPWLASSWTFGEGGRTLTFTVRRNVTFSDGRPLTADDFVYSMQLPLKHTELSSWGIGYTAVDKVGPDRVRLTFDKPAYQDLVNCTKVQIVPKHVWERHDPATWVNPDPVGTGPCTLAGFSTQQYLFKRRADYWGGALPMSYVRYLSATEDSAKLMLIDGQLDLAPISWPGGQQHFVKRDPDRFFYHPRPGGGSEGILFNHTKAPWNDVHVRRALNMAIDRSTVSRVLADWQQPMSITNLDDTIYRDWLRTEYRGQVQAYDPAGARRELAAGGWQVRNGNLYKHGRHYPLVFHFVGDYPAWRIQTSIMTDNWQHALGLRTHLVGQPYTAQTARVVNGQFDVAYWFCGSGNGIYQSYSSLLDPLLYAPVGKPAAGNFGRWRDPDTGRLLAAMRGTEDQATLRKVGHQLQRIVVDQVPFIPVSSSNVWASINESYWSRWPVGGTARLRVADSSPDLPLMLKSLRRTGR